MIRFRDRAISHLQRFTHTRTLSTTKIHIMDSSNNQQKKEGEKQFSIQPINESGGVDPKFAAHQAHPGPAVAQEMPPQEGTKEERQARKEELNK
ncbi:hypothetical protein V8C35DRAFT_139932 [Trichoderma chlorosporum]